MPDLTVQTDALVAWLSSNGVTLAVVAILMLLGYRWARPRIHRTLVGLIYAQASTLGEDSARMRRLANGVLQVMSRIEIP